MGKRRNKIKKEKSLSQNQFVWVRVQAARAENLDWGQAVRGPEWYAYEFRHGSESNGDSLKVSESGQKCEQSYFPFFFFFFFTQWI